MAKYKVLKPVHHDGKLVTAGEPIELTVAQAEPLVDLGAITVATGDVQEDGSPAFGDMTKGQIQEFALATYGLTLKSSQTKDEMVAAVKLAEEQKLADTAGV